MSKNILIVLLVIVVAVLLLPMLGRAFSKGEGRGAAVGAAATSDTGTPKVVSMSPRNGATGVSPSLTQIVVTFNQAMGDGFSWTGSGPSFPETTGQPHWEDGQTTCVLPVRLKPNWTYRFGLNSLSFKNFRSRAGVPLTPVSWEFSTGS